MILLAPEVSFVTLHMRWHKGCCCNSIHKKKRLCPFSYASARRNKSKKSFSSDWAENIVESDEGSYFDQEQWLTELNELQAPHATRRFPHEHSVQADQKLQLKNLFRSNLRGKNGLGSTWMFQCQNESCPSHETKFAFPTTKNSRGLQ